MERLHKEMIKMGIDSRILCGIKNLKSPLTTAITRPRIIEGILKRFTLRIGLNDMHAIRSFNIKRLETFLDSDILHIQGIHGGFFNYLALPQITNLKPTVYTLHDMWSFTGHCAYSYDCERWKTGCGKCPYPGTTHPVRMDNTRLEWRLKNWVYNRSELVIVTLSDWLTKLAKESMLNSFPIYQIPNGVDTDIYRPLNSAICKDLLGIPRNKKVLMVMSMRLDTSHPEGFRKGGDLLINALQLLPVSLKKEIVLLLLGEGGEAIEEEVDIEVLNFGYVSSDQLKIICYSASDLFLFPTRADTFGLTNIESMACGTPVVSFSVGGIPDMIRPGISGYLAKPEDSNDFCNGIIQLLEDKTLRDRMRQTCRTICIEEYQLKLQVNRYINLYNEILKNELQDSK